MQILHVLTAVHSQVSLRVVNVTACGRDERTTGIWVVVVGVEPSLQHPGDLVHLQVLNVVHELPQVGLEKQRERGGRRSEKKVEGGP